MSVFGDDPGAKLLGFLLENPFDEYSISDLHRFTGTHRDTVKVKLEEFILKEYVLAKGEARQKYQLNYRNPTIQNLQKFIDVEGNRRFNIIYPQLAPVGDEEICEEWGDSQGA